MKNNIKTLFEMADVAWKAGYCGARYPIKGTTVAAICMKPVAGGKHLGVVI